MAFKLFLFYILHFTPTITTLCSLKQQIWLRTALCGGWCWRTVLCNLRVACQKRRRHTIICSIYVRNSAFRCQHVLQWYI